MLNGKFLELVLSGKTDEAKSFLDEQIENFDEDIGVNPSVLAAVWRKNLEGRPEQDWKELKGRAVIDEE